LSNGITYVNLIRAGFILIAGYIVARSMRTLTEKLLKRLEVIKYKKLAGQIAFYTILLLFLFSTLDQLGFDLRVLLGAAGVFSVAIAFASQTTISNFISGLFLIFERVVSEGDTISFDGTTGEVISVDLLSTKLKTPDNLFIRVSNETLIKSKLANLSRFPHRRLDITVMLPYEQEVSKVKSLWFSLIEKQKQCLKKPPPDFTVQSIAQNGVSIILSVWVEEKYYAQLKNELQQKILEVFSENNLKLYIFSGLTLEAMSKHDAT
jgi:small-conductance mechanosensitive channel